MTRFRTVDLFPFEGFADRLWDSADRPPGDPVRDAFLRGARPVVARYTEALREIQVSGPRSELLIAVTHVVAPVDVIVDVCGGVPVEGPEWGYVSLTRAVADLDLQGRRELALDVVHAAVRELASARGWHPHAFEACREHVVAHGYVYRWNGPWKSSPDRRHQARATYLLDEPDGFARVRLQVRRHGDEEVLASSAPAIGSCTASRFKASAATLRWVDADSVVLTPLVGHGPSGHVAAVRQNGAWSFTVRDDVSVRTPGGDRIAEDPAAPVPHVVATLS